MFKYLALATSIVKTLSGGPNWTMKGPNIGTIQNKNQRNQCDF